MTEKITSNQENRIADLVRDAVRALHLSKDEAQEIIKVGGTLQREVKSILSRLAILDQRFGPAVTDFDFTVPADYIAKVTNKLLPGKKYRVRIFPILSERVTSEDCMTFLSKHGAVLVGGDGIAVLQANKPDEFPMDVWTVSFDENNDFWKKSDGRHGVPCFYCDPDGERRLDLGYFEKPWNHYYCLMCFSDL